MCFRMQTSSPRASEAQDEMQEAEATAEAETTPSASHLRQWVSAHGHQLSVASPGAAAVTLRAGSQHVTFF